MVGRGEGRGAGRVLDASLLEDDGGGCGPRVLPGLLNLVQQLHAADQEEQALQHRPRLVKRPHALVDQGGGGKDCKEGGSNYHPPPPKKIAPSLQ